MRVPQKTFARWRKAIKSWPLLLRCPRGSLQNCTHTTVVLLYSRRIARPNHMLRESLSKLRATNDAHRGTQLTMKTAQGERELDTDHRCNVDCMSQGCGITPRRSRRVEFR